MKTAKGDRMYLGGCAKHPRYLRQNAEGEIQSGTLYPLSEGVPEGGTPPGSALVTLKRDGAGWVVEDEIRLTGCRTRPTSPAYRSGWDAVYGKRGAHN